MNINNFERFINKTILDRGYDYYIEGNIVNTYKKGDNEYIFQVQGNDDYEVTVKIDELGEILYSECDCPYDFGPICKHQVAAYFELFEIINNNISDKKEVTKKPELNEILDNLSKEELIKIITEITEKDDTLENSLIVRYSKCDDKQELNNCKILIDSIVRKYSGREGFITYRKTYNFVNEMEDILIKAKDTDDILLALDMGFLLINEGIEAFQYADDSNGEIGYLVTQSIEFIGEIASDCADLDTHLREKIFDKLLLQSENKVFDGWDDFRIDILRLCAEFGDVEGLRNKLRLKIEHTVNKNLEDEYKKYSNERLLEILYILINKYGTNEETEQFIIDNLNFTTFREIFISKYIEEKNYKKVIELALEGEIQDKNYAGLVLKWKKIRYLAYKELLMKDEQKILAKELLFDGNFDYYRELKELNIDDKAVFYDNLKQQLKEDKSWRGKDIYLKLIVEENDLDGLLEFVKENPRLIDEYAGILQNKFRDEVIDIYKEHIKASAKSSSNRSAYKGVCEILKRYKKIAGKDCQNELISELISLYSKRPAFIDELSKI